MLSLCFIVLFLWKHGKNKDKLAYIKQRNYTFINKSVLLDHSVSHHSRHVNPPPPPPPLVLSLRPPCSKHVLTFCSSESWSGSFIAGTAPFFSIKWCANPASNWALFIKCSSTNKLAKNCPGKTNWIQCSRNAGFFWKLNKVIFTLQPKTHWHSLETLFLSESRAALPNEALRWACSCSRSSGGNAYCTELCHSDRNLRTAWFQKGDFKTGIKKIHWEDFYHYLMNVYTLPIYIYVQTNCKVNFASDDPFKNSIKAQCYTGVMESVNYPFNINMLWAPYKHLLRAPVCLSSCL